MFASYLDPRPMPGRERRLSPGRARPRAQQKFKCGTTTLISNKEEGACTNNSRDEQQQTHHTFPARLQSGLGHLFLKLRIARSASKRSCESAAGAARIAAASF